MQEIVTNRLILREPRASDSKEILEIRNSSFTMRFNAMTEKNQQQMEQEIEFLNDTTYYLELKENNKVIGAIFLEEDSLRYKINAISISYYLGESYAKKGYMYEALDSLIQNELIKKYEVISARVFSKNIASINLLKKLGFEVEGCIRKCVKGYNDVIFDDIIFSLISNNEK